MFHLRRAAARTFSSQTSAFLSKPRSLVTQTPATLCQRQQWQISSFQRRFASEEASPTQAQTSGETVTTELSQPEVEAKQESERHVENKADQSKQENAVEKSISDVADAAKSSTPSTSDLPQTPEEAVETVKGKVQEVASRTASAARSAADSVLGGGSRRRDASSFSEPKPGKILYVGNLFFEVKAQQLEQEFARHGDIVNSRIAQDERGLSKGFGYVEFDSVDSATAALNALNQKVFQGRRLAVQYHVRREPRNGARRESTPQQPTKTLFIGNMSFQMSDKDLNDLFRDVRNVLDVRVAIDRRSGQPRGFAHADFLDVSSAEAAKKFLEQKEIYGRTLKVDFSKSNPYRPNRDTGSEGRNSDREDRNSGRED